MPWKNKFTVESFACSVVKASGILHHWVMSTFFSEGNTDLQYSRVYLVQYLKSNEQMTQQCKEIETRKIIFTRRQTSQRNASFKKKKQTIL